MLFYNGTRKPYLVVRLAQAQIERRDPLDAYVDPDGHSISTSNFVVVELRLNTRTLNSPWSLAGIGSALAKAFATFQLTATVALHVQVRSPWKSALRLDLNPARSSQAL